MIFIELTDSNDWSRKFILRADLIEKIVPSRSNTAEILLTTGRWASCLEGVATIMRLIKDATENGATGE